MKKELDKIYEPQKYEDFVYNKWLKSGFFNPDNLNLPKDAPSYTIVLPPPNITANLHLGHASTLAIEDLFIRYHRMNGFRTLWLPGTDHAAIATQTVVEKKLLKEKNITRHDLGREDFLKEVWNFLEKTQATILNQTKKMGASLDWSRLAFTLDEERQKAVKTMFVKMYEAGAIYRGERVINWCPRCGSTLADDEVDYKEQNAKLYTFKYDENFPFYISTTRPETKLGDSAVAVNPKDERYKEYIGKTIKANFCGVDLKIKIIADRNVEMDFGTGALGVTPAHSMVDWIMAEENNLEIKKIINEKGEIYNTNKEYDGLNCLEAREKIVAKLKANNLLKEEEDFKNNLSVCYRCSTPIEPLPSKQWFVSVDKKIASLNNKSLKEKAIEAATKKDITFIPSRFTKKYLDWMNNLKDWCISRQIWFGHRIPVWYKNEEIYVGLEAPIEEGWIQDSDTLDTWFSSGMWTFSTLGWPDNFIDSKKVGDLAKFHPTQILETGYEIITLWVSRMIMMSFFAIGEIPFEKVYLHGMVLDEHGKKMSKSKGNGIDPINMIGAYGTDAVRLSLLIGSTPGNDFRYNEEKIANCRNFINKLWNIARFIISNNTTENDEKINFNNLTLPDKYIISKLNFLIIEVNKKITNYDFSLAGEMIKDFTLNELADWYLEASKFLKTEETPKILIYVLKNLLKLWHPFIPFITETIWQELNEDKLLMITDFPKVDKKLLFNDSESDFEFIKNIIIAIRNGRNENKIDVSKKIKACIFSDKNQIIKNNEILIKSLRTNLEEIETLDKNKKIDEAIFLTINKTEIYLIGGLDKDKEKTRISKEVEKLINLINGLEGRLDNKEFIKNAPEKIVENEKNKLIIWKNDLKKLKDQLSKL